MELADFIFEIDDPEKSLATQDLVVASFSDKVAARFSELCAAARTDNLEASLSTAENFQNLSGPLQAHLILSPAFVHAVQRACRVGDSARFRNVRALVEDELTFMLPPSVTMSGSVAWTPMGDACLISGSEGLRVSVPDRISTLLVDFDSPRAQNTKFGASILEHAPEHFSSPERGHALLALREAMELIDLVSVEFGSLVRNFTRSLVCRKTTRAVSCYRGFETDDEAIGEVRLVNPHRRRADAFQMPRQILAASLTSMCHTFHFAFGYGVSRTTSTHLSKCSISPWSAGPVTAHEFVTEVITRYWLWRFSTEVIRNPGLPSTVKMAALRARTEDADAFVRPTRLSDYVMSGELNGTVIARTLNHIQDLVRQRHMMP